MFIFTINALLACDHYKKNDAVNIYAPNQFVQFYR